MSQEKRAYSNPSGIPVDTRIVCVIVGALALIAPVFILVSRYDIAILAMTWYYSTQFSFNVIHPMNVYILLLIGLRVLFIYQIFRYYEGKSSRGMTLALGAITEIVPYFGLWPFPTTHFLIPTPLMLLSALFFILFRPPFEIDHHPSRIGADSPS